MKVESVNPALAHVSTSSVTARVSSSATARASSATQASTQSAAQDRTSLHSDSNSVQALASQALKTPEVRQDKVDALSTSVKANEYQVDASRLAAAISGASGK